jgi:hypothetical protein
VSDVFCHTEVSVTARSLVQRIPTEYGVSECSGVPRNFVRWGGVQQIQLRTEDRENGDLGAVAPSQGFWRQL